jgi:FkbM family methyltransferase
MPGRMEYLSLRPVGLASALRLYVAFGAAWLARLVAPRRFRGAGRYLYGRSPVRVRVNGLRFDARPRSEDLLYLLPSHKGTVQRWFRPTAGQTVVDVGAHVGYYSIRAASLGAHVVSIEPNPSTAAALRANVRLNHLENVRVEQVALGSSAGSALLEVPEIWDGRASFHPGWASGGRADTRLTPLPVRVVTLDNLMGANPPPSVDWLLIDVEGSELEVLQGGRATLRKTRHLLLEISEGSEEACRSLLVTEHGFRVLSVERQTPHTEYLVAQGPDPRGA